MLKLEFFLVETKIFPLFLYKALIFNELENFGNNGNKRNNLPLNPWNSPDFSISLYSLLYTPIWHFIQFYFKCIIELLFTLFICAQSATGALFREKQYIVYFVYFRKTLFPGKNFSCSESPRLKLSKNRVVWLSSFIPI